MEDSGADPALAKAEPVARLGPSGFDPGEWLSKLLAAIRAEDAIAAKIGCGFLPTTDEARRVADYILAYSNTISKEMYRGERPSGIWNLEQAVKLLRLLADVTDAAQAIEAGTAKTEGLGPKDESAVAAPSGDAS